MDTIQHKPSSGIPVATIVLVVVWLALGAWMAVAVARHESLAGDLAVPAFAFFASTAWVVSRIYARFAPHDA